MLYSFADRARRQGRTLFRSAQGTQDDSSPATGKGGRGGLWTDVSSRLREKSPVLRLLHAARQESQPTEPARRNPRVSVPRHQRPTRRGSIRPAKRSSSPFRKADTTAATFTSAPTGCSISPRATPANPNPPDPFNTGQDISDLLSSISANRRRPQGRGQELRRSQGQSVRRSERVRGRKCGPTASAIPGAWASIVETGELFVGDVGWELWESVHRVEKGGNYGWSAMEGPQPIKPEQVGPTPIIPALIELPHTIACSVTGGRVYRGKKFPGTARRLHLRRLGDAPTVGCPVRERSHQRDAGNRAAVGAHCRLRRGQGWRTLFPRLRWRHGPHHRAE